MIIEYHRPVRLEEALDLLGRASPRTIPLAGGTAVSRRQAEEIAVVDLQALGLDEIIQDDQILRVGAMASLEQVYRHPSVHSNLKTALQRDISQNARQMATLPGTIVACDGRSQLVTALLAMDVKLIWLPGDREVNIGNFLPLRSTWGAGGFIRAVEFPMNTLLVTETVARSPMDRAIVCVAACRWPSGRTRVALGGYGKEPVLAFDGPEPTGADLAAKNAYLHAEDAWATAGYRSEIAAALTRKLLKTQVNGRGGN